MTVKLPGTPEITFTVIREAGKIVEIQASSPEVTHFLQMLKLTRAYNTWINYAFDLKFFFTVVGVPPASIGRSQCLDFIKHQHQEGRSHATVNRRLAAVSSLFHELHLLDPIRFPDNPVYPFQRTQNDRRRNSSLYNKQHDRIPDTVEMEHLQHFFRHIRTWRDRTLIMLMWVSCLRISEAVAIRFDDLECSRRQIRIRDSKGNHSRIAYMDSLTFAALNRYLDHERCNFAPDEDHIFIALKGRARGKPLSVNSVQKMVAYYVKTRSLDHIHPHLLRHTGITQLISQGMSEPAVRALVGHRHPASLQPYLHLSDAYIADEFDRAQRGLDLDHLSAFTTEGDSE